MYFSLDVRRAHKGDCLLLHFGSENDPGLVLIDGGPRDVYGPQLRPRIEEIRRKRRIGEGEPLAVDVLMVSHVDDDHIQGILDLTRELIQAEDDNQPPLVRVSSLWHNSFDAIIDKDPAVLTAAVSGGFGAAALEGELPADATLDDADFDERPDEEVIVDTLKVLASVAQGHRLRDNAERLGFIPTLELGGELVIAAEGEAPVEIGRGLTFKVVGPMKPELIKLQRDHDAWLAELAKKGKSPTAALAAYADESVPNLSSLVVLAEAGGKKMLLTGDARGDKVLKGLELVGLVAPGGAMHVDVLKVPHHGSARNLEDDFFQRITADHYVFSGDGEHGNPERESLEMLLRTRGEDAPFSIHITYPLDEVDVERKRDWEKEQAKERKRKEKRPTVVVRPDWSPAEHGLVAFFHDHPRLEARLRIVADGERHLIDLLDPVPF